MKCVCGRLQKLICILSLVECPFGISSRSQQKNEKKWNKNHTKVQKFYFKPFWHTQPNTCYTKRKRFDIRINDSSLFSFVLLKTVLNKIIDSINYHNAGLILAIVVTMGRKYRLLFNHIKNWNWCISFSVQRGENHQMASPKGETQRIKMMPYFSCAIMLNDCLPLKLCKNDHNPLVRLDDCSQSRRQPF